MTFNQRKLVLRLQTDQLSSHKAFNERNDTLVGTRDQQQ